MTNQLKFLLPTQTTWNTLGVSLLLRSILPDWDEYDDYHNDFGVVVRVASRRNGKTHTHLQTLTHPALRKVNGSSPLQRVRNSITGYSLETIEAQMETLLTHEYKLIELTFDTTDIEYSDLSTVAHFLSLFIYAPKRNEFTVKYFTESDNVQFKYDERPIVIDGLHTTVYELVMRHNGDLNILGYTGEGNYGRTTIDYCNRYQYALGATHAESSGIYEDALNRGLDILKTKPTTERPYYWLVMVNKCLEAYAKYLAQYQYESDSINIEIEINELIAMEYLCKLLVRLDVVNQCKRPVTRNGKLPHVNKHSLFTCINSLMTHSGVVKEIMGDVTRDTFLTYLSWLQMEAR